MKILPVFLLAAGVVILASAGCVTTPDRSSSAFRVAFGSCMKQGKPQPIWGAILETYPDLFVFAGDNIYGDTEDMEVMREKYAQLGNEEGYRLLSAHCPILATWDDHDYGVNDGGAEYPQKEASKREMLDFFDEPADSLRRTHPGVYDSRMIEEAGMRIQVILLDTRTFRGPLVRHNSKFPDQGPYQPTTDTSTTILGEEQWAWLAARLAEPADWRVVVSSIQVLASEHHWEGWMNFPHEKERLFALIRETGASGLIFLSGDRHHGELSQKEDAVDYPLYDFTASGLNYALNRPKDESNRYRVGGLMLQNHFGLLDFTPEKVLMRLLGEKGDVVLEHEVLRTELQISDFKSEI